MTELQQQILELKKIMSPKEIRYQLGCCMSLIYRTKSPYSHKKKIPRKYARYDTRKFSDSIGDAPIIWKCECGYGNHHYYITCPLCGIDNPLDGKKNKLGTQN